MGDAWILVRALHLLAMALFVGGQLVLAIAVVPVGRRAPDRENLRAIARRFGWGTLAAIAVLVATGSAMAGHFHQWGDPKLHVKLALVGLAVLLIVWHMRRPDLHALQGVLLLASVGVVWLGVALAHS